jgi:hypothetical protein
MRRALFRPMPPRIVILAVALAAALAATARPAAACVRASEASKLVGWSADGKYALYELILDDKTLDHAEILPTIYTGFVYTIMPDYSGNGIVVSRAKVGSSAAFGDDDSAIVERKASKLTEASVLTLKTVAAMQFGTVETATKPAKPKAAFTGKKRYEIHDVELTGEPPGELPLVMPLPVYCVGSCLADENWTKWSITVDGVHQLATGTVLYELSMPNVCNGGTIHRLITQTPAAIKVPKQRSMGSGG